MARVRYPKISTGHFVDPAVLMARDGALLGALEGGLDIRDNIAEPWGISVLSSYCTDPTDGSTVFYYREDVRRFRPLNIGVVAAAATTLDGANNYAFTWSLTYPWGDVESGVITPTSAPEALFADLSQFGVAPPGSVIRVTCTEDPTPADVRYQFHLSLMREHV